MPKEKAPLPEIMLRKAHEFIRLGSDKGINNFTLKGSVDVPTYFDTFVCIFPDLINTEHTSLNIVGSKIVDARSTYNKILNLELPDRLKNLPVKDDKELSWAFERYMALRGLPSLIVAIGKTQEKNEEVILLFSVSGFSPETSLKKVKERIKERMPKLGYSPN